VTWEDVLQTLHALIGREVLISVSPLDEGAPMVSLLGVLERGEPSRAQEALELLGRARPGDEAITFRIAPDNSITLSRGRFRQAGKDDGVAGQLLWMEHGGTLITITDANEAREAAARLSEA
jgi:hypothetical protein